MKEVISEQLEAIYNSKSPKAAAKKVKNLLNMFLSNDDKKSFLKVFKAKVSADASNVILPAKLLRKDNVLVYDLQDTYKMLLFHFFITKQKISIKSFGIQLAWFSSFLENYSTNKLYKISSKDEIDNTLKIDLVKRILPFVTEKEPLHILRINGIMHGIDAHYLQHTNTIILSLSETEKKCDFIPTLIHEIALALAFSLTGDINGVPKWFFSVFEESFHNKRANVPQEEFPVVFADCFAMAAYYNNPYAKEDPLYIKMSSDDRDIIYNYFNQSIFSEIKLKDKDRIIAEEGEAPNIEVFLEPFNNYDNEENFEDYDDESDEFQFFSKKWFEILTYNEKKEKVHAGYITGYFIDTEALKHDFRYNDGGNSVFEFDDNSQLTSDLWCRLKESQKLRRLKSQLYFMNSISLEDEFNYTKIESKTISLIRETMMNCYDIEINSIIYTWGCTELDDDTIKNREFEYWIRHKHNLLKEGFKEYKEDDKTIYLYKSLPILQHVDVEA